VTGIGLNVNMDAATARSAGVEATSLHEIAGEPVSRVQTFRSLLTEMDRRYLALLRGESLLDEWRARLETIGRRVSVTFRHAAVGGQAVKGQAEGVDELGRLLVRDDRGRVWPLAAGEVTLQSPR
jgi:BirA family biotin operon repressor/biotin-[acetyl-CoA-carboxylase] ligase